jgi:tetratricopeptide (TPR) repeat protein
MRATTCLGDDILPRGRKTRALLAYLCLVPAASVARTAATELLWGSGSDPMARNSLRQAVRELTSAFGPIARSLITATRAAIRIDVDACWIDARSLLSRREALLDPVRLLEGMDHTSARFDKWLEAERSRFTGLLPERANAGAAAVNAPTRRLRVGVLPFYVDDGKDDLGLSLSQEIAAGLSRFRWFDVISPVVLRETGSRGIIGRHEPHGDFDYVVDGRISQAGKTLSIAVRLLDLAERVDPIWNETFHLAKSDLHRLDEVVTVPLVARIDPAILHIEGQPKRRRQYGATGLLLLAIPMIFSMSRRKYEEAGNLIERARSLEPGNAMAEAWAAQWHVFHVGQGWSQNPVESYRKAQEHALQAIEIDPENAEALGIYAHCCSIINKNFDAALKYFNRALLLNPSLALNWALSAATYCYIGEPDVAIDRLRRYRELTPADLGFSWFESFYTVAYTFKGDYERAVLVGRRAVKSNPNFTAGYKPLIAALGLLGRVEEARPYVDKLCALEPTFTVERFGEVYPFKRDEDRQRYLTGLRRAGVPERLSVKV